MNKRTRHLIFMLAFVFMPLCYVAAHATDLPLPAKPAERCLTPGEQPSAGQTLHVDKRCKSGLRWVYERS